MSHCCRARELQHRRVGVRKHAFITTCKPRMPRRAQVYALVATQTPPPMVTSNSPTLTVLR
jgi:hypothetical protein